MRILYLCIIKKIFSEIFIIYLNLEKFENDLFDISDEKEEILRDKDLYLSISK